MSCSYTGPSLLQHKLIPCIVMERKLVKFEHARTHTHTHTLSLSLSLSPSKDHILILGWQFMVVLSGKDGEVATSLRLPCEPIAPPVVADFTEDGWNDVIITCKKQ